MYVCDLCDPSRTALMTGREAREHREQTFHARLVERIKKEQAARIEKFIAMDREINNMKRFEYIPVERVRALVGEHFTEKESNSGTAIRKAKRLCIRYQHHEPLEVGRAHV